jgi:hypothetical protein
VGDGNSVHPYVSDVNQGHQKKMLNKITSVTAAAVVGIAATVTGAQSGAVQWRVEDGGNGHWYQCLRTTGSGEVWNVSQAAANALGGHLATLTSQQENSWVYELSVAQDAWSGRGGPLLGGYKLPNNSFRWVTDEPWSYTSWLPGEPSSGLWEPYLNFLGPQGTSSSGATWNDTDAIVVADNSGGQAYTYVVEWEADCNSDGIVDYGQCLNGTLPDYNSNNVPDCCERDEVCVVGNYPVQWRVEDGGNGHWYATSSSVGTWDAMRTLSIALGGDLASLQSMEENQAANRSRRAQDALTGGGPWIGGRKLPNQAWSWSDGSTWDFMNWAPGEPCCGDAGLYIHLYPDGGWNDHNQTQYPCRALIEWSADCNNDGAVDYGQILRGELPDINHNGAPDTCECIGDINVDGIINGGDLAVLLAYWGPTTNVPTSIDCDLNADGVVNGSDLGGLLAYWGPCSN